MSYVSYEDTYVSYVSYEEEEVFRRETKSDEGERRKVREVVFMGMYERCGLLRNV